MKHSFLITCAVVFLGAGLTAWAQNAFSDSDQSPDQTIARKMGYRTLANGAVIYEEIDDQSLENIAPAAGGGDTEDTGAAPQFKYDPLTQTYRRTAVDSSGNSRQDVINTNDK